MNKTLLELKKYCEEIEPAGALMLTGEWGCGKTYLVEHELKTEISGEAVLLRVSLFGISSAEEIHSAVKDAWFSEYCKLKGLDEIPGRIKYVEQWVSQFKFLPEGIRNIASTNVSSLLLIGNRMEDKKVVLVFDDLERCSMENREVLGIINDYCENKKYHTIIIAHQEKIKKYQQKDCDGKEEISYSEIKEKIICRTVQCVPDYSKIVHAVIEGLKTNNTGYKDFVRRCENKLVELFASDMIEFEQTGEDMMECRGRYHNVRSLKSAIGDFERIYGILYRYQITSIADWFYSFVSYVIAYKADIANEEIGRGLFPEEEIRQLYPYYKDEFMIAPIRRWVLHGLWDEDAVIQEMIIRKDYQNFSKPCEIIICNRIFDVNEETIKEGFAEYLDHAYEGQLHLDDYVLLIENSSCARDYHFSFPVEIDWNKVRAGINICESKIESQFCDNKNLIHYIANVESEEFSEEERNTYKYILSVVSRLTYREKKKLYFEKMNQYKCSVCVPLGNMRLNVFDKTMGGDTAEAFGEANNYAKRTLSVQFKEMWSFNTKLPDFVIEESMNGFEELKNLLKRQKVEYENKKKVFAVRHTEDFITIVEEVMKSIRNR